MRRQGMGKRPLILMLVMVIGISVFTVACGGGGGTETTTTAGGTGTTGAATGEPVKIAFIEGFTGFMAYDATVCEEGILTGLAMLDNQMAGRPVKYLKADDNSDPVVAVDKTRQLVESDKIDYMIGPLLSPATKSVTDYLAKSSGIPQCSLMGQPVDNLTTANKLAFMPCGLYPSWGYYFGKYVGTELGYKSANCLLYDDTAAYGLEAGFEKGFAEGGGKVLSVNYVPMDTVDFSPYLSALKPADCTNIWIFGNGAIPFVKQYKDYGLTAPLIMPMANNYLEEYLKELGDISLGMIGCDIYTPMLDNTLNAQFIAAYQELYPGKYPTTETYTGWQAVMLYNEALKQTGGDSTPAKVIEAMSTISIDTPAGKVTMSPYKDAYIATRDFFIVKTEDVGNGRITWVPIYTWNQVPLGE
jgi:branched-chain amino acid transport system substrate-binding protein